MERLDNHTAGEVRMATVTPQGIECPICRKNLAKALFPFSRSDIFARLYLVCRQPIAGAVIFPNAFARLRS